ncbi:methylated-DNA--[protein]-cysteine S-methyltransferase [Paenibacillus thermoaerophilus]|uniref:Methylated-DNA--protein-cysteine methyltransferase n=1 Tax=Paenibacillus thermoaerophilus TaxID=1215385 RepID=A0ABW2V776_9BACL|nr:methylated-DNA--[protein]-cysteine S-methyltransferase [Paenibacillus thermoaerophilus]TMV07338.1 methylated-DNA--[protein]-cysteine S-methyltransferase [Paenibacillus thermoaerophilus]
MSRKAYRHKLAGPAGAWTLLATEQGLCRILYPQEEASQAGPWLDRCLPHGEWADDRGLFDEFGIIDRLERYFAGQPVRFDDIPLDLRGTDFQRKVWEGLRPIPYGQAWTYKQLAESIGKPKAVRAVGAANGRNPVPIVVPCHRVVGSNGTLTGYRGGLRIKKRLLDLEGVAGLEATGHERFRF